MINALQTIVSRKIDLTRGMGVVSIGSVHAGTASNIIPQHLDLLGSVRANDTNIRARILREIPNISRGIIQANGGVATIRFAQSVPVTVNNAALTQSMLPYLRAASEGRIKEMKTNSPGSEDFSYYAEKVPGLFIFIGATPTSMDLTSAASNHNPKFIVDDKALQVGVRAYITMVVAYAKEVKQLQK